MTDRLATVRVAPRGRVRRMAHAVVGQGRRSVRHEDPRPLDGTAALVTGGNLGIGAALVDRLRGRGADVTVAARSATGAGAVRLDLGDAAGLAAGADAVAAAAGGRPYDLVVLNAGVIPAPGARSPQGHELAFAVNVLGHHVLLERLLAAGAVADGARVVVVTGDIQVLAGGCSATYVGRGRWGANLAYARSKLGSIWLAQVTAERHPGLEVVLVHPGVVASGLVRGGGEVGRITPARSAEVVDRAATDPALPSGTYLHNTLGRIELHPREVAADPTRRAAFAAHLDGLAAPWLG